MKVRKLAVALALAGGLGSGVAQALGLGEIELQSYLNEPLSAEINLPQSRGVDPGDVFVNIASESAYETVGLSRNQFLSKLRFQVITQSDGSLAVNVSSREPLREPYLNFLLELTWPSGRLMREYAVLVDPPVYAEDSGVQERVSAPSVTSSTSQPSTTRSAESVRRQAQAEQSLSRGYQGNTFGPTGASDTLWTIASRVRPDDSVSTQQVMLAIQDLNPDAFIGGNINRLKRGEVLRVPTLDQVQSRTRAEATRVVSQQNSEFQSPERTVDATDTQQAQAAPEQASAAGDELKLLVAENDSSESSDGGSAGGDGELPGGVDAGTAVAMEELESARRENDELNSRVTDLQDQVETLQRLLELKNSQLADMQQMAGDSADESGEAPAPEEGEVSAQGSDGSDLSVATQEDAASDEAADATDAAETESPEAVSGAMDEDATAEVSDEALQAEGADAEVGAPASADADGMAEGGDAGAEGDAEVASGEEPAASAEAEVAEPEAAAPTTEAETAPQQTTSQEPKPSAQPPVVEKGFPGNIIDAITGNPLYQIALGGGLILLLLLLLMLARRNANREKAFYEQLNGESADESDSFELSLDDEDSGQGASDDALTEAESYIAYGRHDQAAQTLEAAISREPSRTDLRLKLLGVYADNQDRESFEKQFGEIEALNDEQATASASELRAQLDEAESMPSIDDLESQLRSDSFGGGQSEGETEAASTGNDAQLSDELLADQYDSEKEGQVENEFGELDTDFADFDLNEVESAETSADAAVDESEENAEQKDSDGSIEYDLSGLSLESEEETADESKQSGTEDETDYSSLEMDLSEPAKTEADDSDWSEDLGLDLDSSLEEESGADESAGELTDETRDTAEDKADSDTDSLDESFLDELDAELDKVAGEEDELGGDEMEESSLDDLELDVSDEDLALMEEFSDSADSASSEKAEAPALDDELNLEDTLGEGDVLGEGETASPEEEIAGTEELEDLGSLDELTEHDEQASESPSEEEEPLPVASDEIGDDLGKSDSVDIDESELGDDDDFDFLAGTDEAATKLDLARAYIEMGDSDGARDILEEVALEGNEEQKSEAQDLLKNLS
ncbi:FimV/HubP family polar landmark protein [Marinobacter sp. F4206]|uniref:FimV/HubP family polar landmark protein n=1 Tax=Marinobacter sp. F4206 TaxID=2861777 RepID=UPI001C5F4BAA|nr:FimV/HubP family polar landmark protein [Marinobacter sp. F4206]MBW4933325.1 hypothetical protein [Marinobacter sp. F4206]